MFDSLSSRLEGIVTKLRGTGRLTEADVDEMLKGLHRIRHATRDLIRVAERNQRVGIITCE